MSFVVSQNGVSHCNAMCCGVARCIYTQERLTHPRVPSHCVVQCCVVFLYCALLCVIVSHGGLLYCSVMCCAVLHRIGAKDQCTHPTARSHFISWCCVVLSYCCLLCNGVLCRVALHCAASSTNIFDTFIGICG